jgi:hypothetical protein
VTMSVTICPVVETITSGFTTTTTTSYSSSTVTYTVTETNLCSKCAENHSTAGPALSSSTATGISYDSSEELPSPPLATQRVSTSAVLPTDNAALPSDNPSAYASPTIGNSSVGYAGPVATGKGALNPIGITWMLGLGSLACFVTWAL